jgi:hypothetical protein
MIRVSNFHPLNAMTTTHPRTANAQAETLAKLYLQGESAEISDSAIAQLCDWLMGEFQSLPLNLQFSNYPRYDTAAEMFADIAEDHLWIAADSYDTSLYPNPIYGFIFQGIHDYDHYLTGSDFSLAGEITAYHATAKRVPSLEIQKILYSEIVLRSAAYLHLGHAPAPKIVFL